jgi:hypothetical protein
LWRIDTRTKAVSAVATAATLTAGDGLLRQGHRLWVVRNAFGNVVELELSGDLRRAKLRRTFGSGLAFPTTVAREANRLLVVNSQLDRRATGTQQPPFVITTIKV